jgi:hypothetical protein
MCEWTEREARKMLAPFVVGDVVFYAYTEEESYPVEVRRVSSNGDVQVRFPPKAMGDKFRRKGRNSENAFRRTVEAADIKSRLFREPPYMSGNFKRRVAKLCDLWSPAMVRTPMD